MRSRRVRQLPFDPNEVLEIGRGNRRNHNNGPSAAAVGENCSTCLVIAVDINCDQKSLNVFKTKKKKKIGGRRAVLSSPLRGARFFKFYIFSFSKRYTKNIKERKQQHHARLYILINIPQFPRSKMTTRTQKMQ